MLFYDICPKASVDTIQRYQKGIRGSLFWMPITSSNHSHQSRSHTLDSEHSEPTRQILRTSAALQEAPEKAPVR